MQEEQYDKYWYLNKHNFKLFNKFTNILMLSGGKKKIKLVFSKIFFYFYYLVDLKNPLFNDFENILEMYKHNYNANSNLYFFNSFFRTVTDFLLPSYTLKFTKLGKKDKTKLKKYSVTVDYIYQKDRLNLSFKWLIYYSKTFFDKMFHIRLFKSLFYTYIEGNNSFLFLKKIEIYNKFLTARKKKNQIK